MNTRSMVLMAHEAGFRLDRRRFIAGSAAAAACSAFPAMANSPMRQVSVDAGAVIGKIRSLQGTNSFPRPLFTRSKLAQVSPGWHAYGKNNEFVMALSSENLTAFMEAARIDFARLHDAFGPGDIDARFVDPALAERNRLVIFPDMAADPADPRSYNFGPTDDVVRPIVEAKLKLVFRIGRSIWGGAEPPQDLEKYAEIVRRIVLHYNQGWADGFHYNLDHWEIWNEPDIGLFWKGSSQDYFRLYELCARAIKSVDPALKVGGPTLALPDRRQPLIEEFLAFVRSRQLPLDFFSFHHYPHDSNDPYNFSRIATQLRKTLDERDFHATELFLDEWNSDFAGGAESLSKAGRAAFVASALIYLQNSPADRTFYYGKVGDMTDSGFVIDEVGRAIVMAGAMTQTPNRLATKGDDNRGFGILAGVDAAGNIQIWVSNYQIPAQYRGLAPKKKVPESSAGLPTSAALARIPTSYKPYSGYELLIRGLEDEARYEIAVETVSDAGSTEKHFTAQATNSMLRIERITPAQTVELIRIRKA